MKVQVNGKIQKVKFKQECSLSGKQFRPDYDTKYGIYQKEVLTYDCTFVINNQRYEGLTKVVSKPELPAINKETYWAVPGSTRKFYREKDIIEYLQKNSVKPTSL